MRRKKASKLSKTEKNNRKKEKEFKNNRKKKKYINSKDIKIEIKFLLEDLSKRLVIKPIVPIIK